MGEKKKLEYPFDWRYINRKKKTLKKILLDKKTSFLEKKNSNIRWKYNK